MDKKLVRPIVTEKSMGLTNANMYVFQVAMGATKGAVEAELKRVFGVDVLEIKTMIMPGKKKRILKTYRFKTTPKWKKAIVKLKEGQKIDLFPKEGK
ncbi:50S ribosomal protein L23 [candidate division WWE3 bacterium]|uniref:Large ribosomal subunit protein uL23 n=1 Tax=candidate division WWE3 bacterium TaxID=2053526 RepID=A0A7X9DK71_UNCKA|nr:50S ribosomal protein L23 [candidate division WWE3 bacterium]